MRKSIYIRALIFVYPQKFLIVKRKKFLSLIGLGFISSLFFAAKEKQPAIVVTDCDDR
jgi:hypothetical protein